jgi:hypothetical protein
MKYLVFASFLLQINLSAQEIFRLDFEETLVPENWQASNKAEWGHVIGENGSNYFRFHPYSNTAILQSPVINLSDGFYTLYFSWNETGNVNPNFINIKIKRNNQPWQEIADFGGSEGGATARNWLKDSVEIGSFADDNLTIQFDYKSDGKYPSQYMGLDNIYLTRIDQITGLFNPLEKVVFSIFPNPASQNLQVNVEDIQQRIFECFIYNSDGKIVFQKANVPNGIHSLDVSNFVKGIYLIEIHHADGIKSEQFIIQ